VLLWAQRRSAVLSRDERMIACRLIELRSNSGSLGCKIKVCTFRLDTTVKVKPLSSHREDARAPKRFGGCSASERSWETAHAIIRSKHKNPVRRQLIHCTAIESYRYPHHTIRHRLLIPAPTHRHRPPLTLLPPHTPTQWPRDTVWTTREIPAHGSHYLILAVHSAWEYVGNTKSA
jgi:hypothetical protein